MQKARKFSRRDGVNFDLPKNAQQQLSNQIINRLENTCKITAFYRFLLNEDLERRSWKNETAKTSIRDHPQN